MTIASFRNIRLGYKLPQTFHFMVSKLDYVALSLYKPKLRSLAHIASKKPVQVVFCLTILFTAVALAMIIMSKLVVKPLTLHTVDVPAEVCLWEHASLLASDPYTKITVAFEVMGIDPIARTLQVEWYPAPKSDCSTNPGPSLVANIYVNPLNFLIQDLTTN